MTTSISVDRDGHVEIWTLNLPESRNPISGSSMIEAFESRIAAANAEPDVRAIILTGAGSVFSAGGNVNDMLERNGMFSGTPQQMMEGYRQGIQRIPRAMFSCDVPMIAAVNGPAVGAGCDLAMMCDLRIASTTAFFAESFVKLGIVAGDGGAWLLPRVIGPARAAEMALTGDRIDAATALEWGLVSRVVEPEQLMSEATELARRVAVNPPLATRMTKRLLRSSLGQTLDQALELAASFQSLAHTTQDHAEALQSFVEKRPGSYTAR